MVAKGAQNFSIGSKVNVIVKPDFAYLDIAVLK